MAFKFTRLVISSPPVINLEFKIPDRKILSDIALIRRYNFYKFMIFTIGIKLNPLIWILNKIGKDLIYVSCKLNLSNFGYFIRPALSLLLSNVLGNVLFVYSSYFLGRGGL